MTQLHAQPVVCPVLVGRETQLASLEGLLEQVRRGRGRTALISGEAGIGKTRLLDEVTARAEASGFLSLRGSAFERDVGFPFAPAIDLLRSYFADLSAQQLQESLGPLAGEFVKLLPELSLVLPGIEETPPLENVAEKRRLFEALTRFFVGLSASRPLIVALEDIHWSDETSLEFFHFLARRIGSRPVLLVATYRPEEPGPELESLLWQLERQRLAEAVALDPLPPAQVVTMLRATLDARLQPSPGLAEMIGDLSEGNPFYVEEIVRSLLADSALLEPAWTQAAIGGIQLELPRSLRMTVARKLDLLPEGGRRLIALAAVAGRRFDFRLLQMLMDGTEEELLELMKLLIEAQLLVEESADRFAFHHALTREAVYATLLGRERRDLHETVAKSLERLAAAGREPPPADLAYHYFAAESWEKAFEYASRAGERAFALFAPRIAARHFSQAIEAASRKGVSPPADIYRSRGWAFESLGEPEKALADLQRALELARSAGAQGEWRATLDLGRYWASHSNIEAGRYFRRALEKAEALGDPEALAHSLNRIGNWHLNMDQPGLALIQHDRALVMFESRGHDRGIAESLDLMGLAHHSRDDQVAGIAHYEKAAKLFRELDDRRALASCLLNLAELRGLWLCWETAAPVVSDQARALDEVAEALRLAREILWRSGETWSLYVQGLGLAWHGEYGAGLDSCRRGLELAEEAGNRQWTAIGNYVLGGLYVDLFASPSALRCLERAHALAVEMNSPLLIRPVGALLALAWLQERNYSQAEKVLADSARRPGRDEAESAEHSAESSGERRLLAARAQLLLAKGDPASALTLAEKLIAAAPNAATGAVFPHLEWLRGEGLIALGRQDSAERSLRSALESAQQQGGKLMQMRLHRSLARLLPAGGPSGEAAHHLQKARKLAQAVADALGDESLEAGFLEGALGDAAVGPRLMPGGPAPGPSAEHDVNGLTPREREIASKVAEGKSNKKVARELEISERTVEKHVSNILGKLSLHSRSEIVAWVLREGAER